MQIRNYNNINFRQAPLNIAKEAGKIELGKQINDNIRNIPKLEELVKGKIPLYLKVASAALKKLAPFSEEKFLKKKYTVEDLVNLGNISKELVCMIVYPLQVLTNPDLPKDKRRFIGLYDFYVTCFSLAGTLAYALKGKTMVKDLVSKMMQKKYLSNLAKYPKAVRAVEGGAFVLGIAVQTILFKRILAPALSPPLAAKTRKWMESNDKKKEELTSKESKILIPPENDAALTAVNNKSIKHSKKSSNDK